MILSWDFEFIFCFLWRRNFALLNIAVSRNRGNFYYQQWLSCKYENIRNNYLTSWSLRVWNFRSHVLSLPIKLLKLFSSWYSSWYSKVCKDYILCPCYWCICSLIICVFAGVQDGYSFVGEMICMVRLHSISVQTAIFVRSILNQANFYNQDDRNRLGHG